MFKKINRFVAYLKVFFYLFKEQESFDHVATCAPLFSARYSQEDIICLSMGRWLYFKHINLPQYTIGLDKDHESLLDQYTYKKLNGKGRLIWDYTLDQTRMKIEICKECVDTAQTMRQYLIKQKFIKD